MSVVQQANSYLPLALPRLSDDRTIALTAWGSQRANHAGRFVEGLSIFIERVGVGDDAAANRELDPAVFERKRANEDAAVEVATGSEEEQTSAVGSANGWFHFCDDFHRADFGCSGNRAAGKTASHEVPDITIVAQGSDDR